MKRRLRGRMIQGRREMIDGVYIGAQLAVPELEGGSVLILRRRDHFFKKNIFMSTGEMGLLLAGFRGFRRIVILRARQKGYRT